MTIETDLLSNELIRIGTFIGLPNRDSEGQGNVKASVTELVKAGFYFTGSGDLVRCFSCGLEIHAWKNHLDPFMVHAAGNPQCKFILDNCNGDRPDFVPSPVEPAAGLAGADSETSTSSNTLNTFMSFLKDRVRCVTPQTNIPCSSSVNRSQCDISPINKSADQQHLPAVANGEHPLRRRTTTTDVPQQTRSSSASNSPGTRRSNPRSRFQRARSDVAERFDRKNSSTNDEKQHSNQNFDLTKFRESEEARAQTFSNWAGTSGIRAREFAQAGFVYIGPADRVQCVFCGGILRNWKSDESPLEEHYKHYPECSFAVESLSSVVLPKPRHSRYRSEPVRLSSFYDWDPSWNPKPMVLAKAGFFYTGCGDRVRCFFCNGALCKWESHDDPWKEHARWFPKCPYVKHSKGQAFIDGVSVSMPLAKRQTVSLDKTDKKLVVMEQNLSLLAKENRLLKQQKQCKVCLDKEVCVTFIPCGHLVCCLSCASALQLCPICRAKIRKMMRIYLS